MSHIANRLPKVVDYLSFLYDCEPCRNQFFPMSICKSLNVSGVILTRPNKT